jgi:SAM-dependent methyltransferase
MNDKVGMVGNAPIVGIGKAPAKRPAEAEIYRQMWEHPEYRQVAPGETSALTFLEQARPKKGATVLDMGCGTGRGSLMLAVAGMNVTMLDFAANCLDADIVPMLTTQAHALRFIETDLTKPLPANAEYGFCTDVLEHIPPEQVDAVLDNCLKAAQHVYFDISTEDDVCGALIGHPLHLSVHSADWWLAKFRERGCAVHWSASTPEHCVFYVTAWVDGQEVVDVGILNMDMEQVKANVRANLKCGYAEVTPHETQDTEVMIVGGGPSLNAHVEEIRKLRADGVKLVALNGAHDWCLDNGLVPSAQIIVDARPFNARFTRRPVVADDEYAGCKYLIASQCDPAVLEGLPFKQVLLWHTTAESIRKELDEASENVWYGVPGGSTVLLRALPMLRMLGYRKFHLYGCDSCLHESEHHAYSQPENDDPLVIPVTVGGRVFYCHAWMVSQAQEFMTLIKFLGDEMEIEVHGDGLLGHILNTGAALADLQAADLQPTASIGE